MGDRRSQSYLYGIEMPVHSTSAMSGKGLNRTFMELKSLNGLKRALRLDGSQSYLYGIEIKMRAGVLTEVVTVSIVPLWN